MKKYLINNPEFTGSAELWYNQEGRLIRIDVADTNMRPKHVEFIKRIAPVHEKDMQPSLFSSQTTIIEADVEITFEQFWATYNHKINKARCEPLWNKLSKADKVLAYVAIKRYKKYLRETGYRAIADPEKYLRNKYWENEY